MAASEQLLRLIERLKEIFEIDKSDLDFGIYRILNIRKKEIEKFLAEGLPKRVQETLAPFATDTSVIENRIREIEGQLGDSAAIAALPATIPVVKEYAELKAQLAKGVDLSGLEADVYSHLLSFFSRYYEEGDFISKRRYKEGVYAIPYEGEEVKLHWANADQYYIKTSENFKDYTFMAGEYTVHFRLVDATTEQNNNKETADSKRVFMLYNETEEHPEIKTFEYDGERKELVIRFVFDIPEDKKFDYAADNEKRITTWIANECKPLFVPLLGTNVSKDPKKPLTLLGKHLKAYVAKNTFDYFIHKDLGGFLSRELDFYIKNEVMHLDDVDTTDERKAETWLAQVRAIKRVGKVIIDFLAQIENFQKKLWLKKKFVLSTNYCMTLDRVPEEFYPEIAANDAQREEWVKLFAIDELATDLEHQQPYSVPLTVDFLKQNQNLVVDTKFFNDAFKESLLESIDNLDEQCDGVLMHSENYQGIRFLNARYRRNIDCMYLDPPYNTDASEIMYKNGYKHSSWLSLMCDRLKYALLLFKPEGLFCVTIDDFERDYLALACTEVYGRDNRLGTVCIRSNPQGRSTVKGFSINHEYGFFYASDTEKSNSIGRLSHNQAQINRYNETDDKGKKFQWENFRKTGTDSNHSDRVKQFYYIFVNSITLKLRVPKQSWNEQSQSWMLCEPPLNDEISLLPINDLNEEKVWKWGIERTKQEISLIKAEITSAGQIQLYRRNYYNESGSLPSTWWDKAEYASGSHGTNLLTDLFGVNRMFTFPKSLFAVKDSLIICCSSFNGIILDYFAGSGTTGHAVMNLNREDGGKRKYILVEMGAHFDTVLKPRLEKVAYAKDWKDGKPVSRTTGISHCFKYLSLESYEDALSNIELPSDAKVRPLLDMFGEEYLVKYMLDLDATGSILNLDAFKEPFAYQLKVTEKNETKNTNADLVETFNYLIGLTVTHSHARKSFHVSTASAGDYEGAAGLAADANGKYTFRQIEGTLRDGQRVLVIWRTIGDNLRESNAVLDAYFTRYRINPADREFDVIYINGDNNVENLRKDDESWKVRLIEPEFKKRMFEEE